MKLPNHSKARGLEATFRARASRNGMGVSEQKLWEFLRRGRFGVRFRRQHPVGPYVLDFYCPQCRICVEVDGEHHLLRVDRDSQRDEYLASLGVLTLRVPSLDLFDEAGIGFAAFLTELQRQIELRRPPDPPPPA